MAELGSAAQGAAQGAAKGAIFGLPGKVVGGIIGGIRGLFGGSSEKDEAKQKQANINAASSIYQQAYQKLLEGDPAALFGSKPGTAALALTDFPIVSSPERVGFEKTSFSPTNFSSVISRALGANLNNVDALNQYIGIVNRENTARNLERIEKISPGFLNGLRDVVTNAGSLAKGQLPTADVLESVADRGTLAGTLGVPGGAINQTLRDIGLSRLNAIKEGNALLSSAAGTAEVIDPASQKTQARELTVSPEALTRLASRENQFGAEFKRQQNQFGAEFDRQQNQFGAEFTARQLGKKAAQEFDQNQLLQQIQQGRLNIEAAADPQAVGTAGLELQLAGLLAGLRAGQPVQPSGLGTLGSALGQAFEGYVAAGGLAPSPAQG